MKTRRDFVKTSVAAGAGTILVSSLARRILAEEGELPAWRRVEVKKAKTPLKILILGGTGFLGPHTVDHALARGHEVTLFNRGKRNPEIFKELETILGDRDGKLDGLKGRKWDAVIDNSGYVPRIVKMSAELLAPNVKQYVFISSISVFGETVKAGADETAPVETVPDPTSEEVMKYYGGLKALCEKAATEAMGGRATNVRPGLIVGPMDPTDRFTYWPVRIERGGDVLAPGDGTDPVQVIDVRDLSAFLVKCVEDGSLGTFNATGPAKEMSMKTMLEACKKASGSSANLVWVDTPFLEKNEVQAWSEMPAWVPGNGETAGFGRIDVKKAIGKGLTFRPILETSKDTLTWWKTLPDDRKVKMRAGLAPDKEEKVLAAWKAR